MDLFDDYDFTPSANSNLSTIFESSSSSDVSLIYNAPKQPKDSKVEEKPADVKPSENQSSVVASQVVTVWKLEGTSYSLIGKLGLAIIAYTNKNHELILYKDKLNVTLKVKICPGFEILSQKNNFASLYDPSNINWLIKFTSPESINTILSKIESLGGKITKSDEEKETSNNEPKAEPIIEKQPDNVNVENKAKADILSRIAKMGQSILPNEDNEHTNHEIIVANKEPEKIDHKPDLQVVSTPSIPNTFNAHPQQYIPNNFIVGQPMAFDPLNMFLSETRTQNTEVRMNLSQITQTLTQVLKAVENKGTDSSVNQEDPSLKSKVKVLELKADNLSRELISYQDKCAELERQLFEKNQSMKHFQDNKFELEQFKQQQSAIVVELTNKITLHEELMKTLSQTVDSQKKEIEELNGKLLDSEKNQDTILELNQTITELKSRLKDQENAGVCEKTNVSETENEEKRLKFITSLKESMNSMYASITNHNSEENIHAYVGNNIKITTLQIIHDFNQLFKN